MSRWTGKAGARIRIGGVTGGTRTPRRTHMHNHAVVTNSATLDNRVGRRTCVAIGGVVVMPARGPTEPSTVCTRAAAGATNKCRLPLRLKSARRCRRSIARARSSSCGRPIGRETHFPVRIIVHMLACSFVGGCAGRKRRRIGPYARADPGRHTER